MTKKKKRAARLAHLREKQAVQFTPGPAGSLQLRIDFGQLPEPALYYYADAIALKIDSENHMAVLGIGRAESTRDRFADRIEIVMPADKLFGDFWRSANDVRANLDQILEAQHWNIYPFRIEPPAGVVQTFFANMLFMAVAVGESSLDFYHLSPRQTFLAKTGQTQNMLVLPVVRVNMSTPLSKYFFSLLAPHAVASINPVREPDGVVHA